jgi:hypothetical protein
MYDEGDSVAGVDFGFTILDFGFLKTLKSVPKIQNPKS